MSRIVLAISGSLRHGSYSTKLLKAFGYHAPAGVELRQADISKLPIFNQDNELPEPDFLHDFKAQIVPADAVLIVTPEYNRSIPPVLKNALDWASRPAPTPPAKRVWAGKPAGIAGVSPYGLGAFGAVHHLRQVLTFLDMPTLQQPEFYLTQAIEKFTDNGELTDESTIEHIVGFWKAFVLFIDKINDERRV